MQEGWYWAPWSCPMPRVYWAQWVALHVVGDVHVGASTLAHTRAMVVRKMKRWKQMRVGDDWVQMVVTHADDNFVHCERYASVKTSANHSRAMSQSQDGESNCRASNVVGRHDGVGLPVELPVVTLPVGLPTGRLI